VNLNGKQYGLNSLVFLFSCVLYFVLQDESYTNESAQMYFSQIDVESSLTVVC
jgi:hypothetical protein